MRRFLHRARGRGPRVLDIGAASVVVEGGDDLGRLGSLNRVAIVAHWSPSAKLSRSVTTLVSALISNGYHVVLVSTAEFPDMLDWSAARPDGVTVLRRRNLGYDFGSWATALDCYPQLVDADRVLLMNDSLAGPFEAPDVLLDRFHSSRADVWAITDTTQFGHHLQSYALGFIGRALSELPLRAFFHDVRVESRKEDVIWRYEIGLSALLRRERFVTDVAIPWHRIVPAGKNPTIVGWRSLLDRGFPFVKRELLLSPDVAPDGDQVRPELRRRFGVVVDEWL